MKSQIWLATLVLSAASCHQPRDGAEKAQAQQPARAREMDSGDSTSWKAVDQAMGRAGKMQPDGVYKYSLPRSDLKVTAAGVSIKPALALGSWVAFRQEAGKTMAMGDLVLTESEITPVIARLQEMGVETTALHNHLVRESPKIMYLHIHHEGDPVETAKTVRAALALTRTPAATPEAPAGVLQLDTVTVAQALAYSGKATGGVYQVSIPRAEPIRVHGMTIPPSMGVATAINFQPTGRNRAAITGDFVMTAHEVSPVLKALTSAGIGINSLHNHMESEEPRLFFVHFWGNDDALKLAHGLRRALDQMKIRQAAM